MPRRRRRGHVNFCSGEVRTYDGTEFGVLIPDDRANWVWDLNSTGYCSTSTRTGLTSFHAKATFLLSGSQHHGMVIQDERLRMHVVAGSYEDQIGHCHPVCWCCEVLGAYVELRGARVMMMVAALWCNDMHIVRRHEVRRLYGRVIKQKTRYFGVRQRHL